MRSARRHFLFSAISASGAALAARPEQPRIHALLDVRDPRVALDAYVKLRGSTADQTVFQPYEGDIFLVADGKVGIPLCGFMGLQKSQWRRDGAGGYGNRDYDLGFYVDYESRKILERWHNPLTGKTVPVYHYRGGPSGGHFALGADASDVYGSSVGRWSLLGDQLWHTSANWGERPNPLTPEQWPLASSGSTVSGSMSLSFAGRVSEIADKSLHTPQTLQIWTNTTAWMPWMEMGQRPGCNFWRWIGAKGTQVAQLSAELVGTVEAVWPGYVTRDSAWETPTSGRLDYMRRVKGLPLTR